MLCVWVKKIPCCDRLINQSQEVEKMSISDEEKRRIMSELARGNVDSLQKNFDDFAQYSLREKQQQVFDRSSNPEPTASEPIKSAQLKDQLLTDLRQAKEAGQLKAVRIREIVKAAVSQVALEFKSGSSDIRLIVKDAVSAVTETLPEKGTEIKEELTASIEGAIEGISSWRRQSISRNQAEVKELQIKIDTEEDELQQEIERLLIDFEEAGKGTSPNVKASIESAITALKNSEEVALMKKRYAQLQAQAAILRANLAAQYGGRTEEVKEHLDEAKTWYSRTRTQAEAVVEQAEHKKAQLEERLSAAGAALGQKERQIKQILNDLRQSAAELLREKEPPVKGVKEKQKGEN